MSSAKQQEYDELRSWFYGYFRAKVLVDTGLVIEAGPIDQLALAQVSTWTRRRYKWDWGAIRKKRSHAPARFELAVSVQGLLCGLIIGKPSRGRRHLSISYLEGAPNEHPLKSKLLGILLDGAMEYGFATGCGKLVLWDPVAKLIPIYEQAGFTTERGKTNRHFCVKSIERS